MCLDACCGCSGIMTGTLDHIGIECALGQKGNGATLLFQSHCCFFEDTYELLSNQLALLLWIGYPGQSRQETLACIDNQERDLQVITEGPDHLLSLTSTQTAVIDKHTGQLVAYSTMEQ